MQLVPTITAKSKKQNGYMAVTRKEPEPCEYKEDTCTNGENKKDNLEMILNPMSELIKKTLQGLPWWRSG